MLCDLSSISCLHSHAELNSHMQGDHHSDYFPLHRHQFKRSCLSVAYLNYKQNSPKGRHAAVSQDSGELCAKRWSCDVSLVRAITMRVIDRTDCAKRLEKNDDCVTAVWWPRTAIKNIEICRNYFC